jgi:hypothetical protein
MHRKDICLNRSTKPNDRLGRQFYKKIKTNPVLPLLLKICQQKSTEIIDYNSDYVENFNYNLYLYKYDKDE